VDKMSFHWLEMDLRPKGSKLVRRLVHEIWPDEHVLAMSSCLGQGTSNKGLDQHKVDAIKGWFYITLYFPTIFCIISCFVYFLQIKST